jgi:hypothetical protein
MSMPRGSIYSARISAKGPKMMDLRWNEERSDRGMKKVCGEGELSRSDVSSLFSRHGSPVMTDGLAPSSPGSSSSLPMLGALAVPVRRCAGNTSS